MLSFKAFARLKVPISSNERPPLPAFYTDYGGLYTMKSEKEKLFPEYDVY